MVGAFFTLPISVGHSDLVQILQQKKRCFADSFVNWTRNLRDFFTFQNARGTRGKIDLFLHSPNTDTYEGYDLQIPTPEEDDVLIQDWNPGRTQNTGRLAFLMNLKQSGQRSCPVLVTLLSHPVHDILCPINHFLILYKRAWWARHRDYHCLFAYAFKSTERIFVNKLMYIHSLIVSATVVVLPHEACYSIVYFLRRVKLVKGILSLLDGCRGSISFFFFFCFVLFLFCFQSVMANHFLRLLLLMQYLHYKSICYRNIFFLIHNYYLRNV